MVNIERITESLSSGERKILPYLDEKDFVMICKKSNLDKVSVLRFLEYLEKKGLVNLSYETRKIIGLGVNGSLYLKKGLPERRLLSLLDAKRIISLDDAKKESGLSDDEFKASLGVLKKKAFIELKNGKIVLNVDKREIIKKSLEEIFLESLPLVWEKLTPENKFAYETLSKRKDIVEEKTEKNILISVTDLGREVMNSKEINLELVEQITPEILKNEKNWKGKKFRRYDFSVPVPRINGGKRHFVNQATDYARDVWAQMGFLEMTGSMTQSSFWNFDALFTAQDHPVRDMQDTFFIDKKVGLPDKEVIKKVKSAHEKGVLGSRGWGYNWDEELAKEMVLRTHTTSLSAHTLSKLDLKDLPKKYFAVGKCFRNETVDWSHGFEFNQTEGIVVDPSVNFRHLLGYLKKFAEKMGYQKVRFRPGYFPYTEPSLEGDVWDEERGEWVELIAAGIFRPEVTEPLLGRAVPVLAWGPGFDRMIMKIYGIKDLREMYKNDLNQLRKMKIWRKV